MVTILRVAEAAAAVLGVKAVVMVQVPLIATLVQVFVTAKAVLLDVTEDTVSAAVPVLVMVTVWVALVVPRVTLPKACVVADREAMGAAAAAM